MIFDYYCLFLDRYPTTEADFNSLCYQMAMTEKPRTKSNLEFVATADVDITVCIKVDVPVHTFLELHSIKMTYKRILFVVKYRQWT